MMLLTSTGNLQSFLLVVTVWHECVINDILVVYDEWYFSHVYCCFQLDSSLQGMLNENSFDLTSKFADLIAASAVSNDASSVTMSTATELRTHSVQTAVSVDIAQQ